MRLGRSETAKRARLERIVRPLKPRLLAAQPGCKIGLKRMNLQPGGGITGLSYAGAAGDALPLAARTFPPKNSEMLFDLTSVFCGLTPELSRTAARNGGVVHVTMQPSREAVSA